MKTLGILGGVGPDTTSEVYLSVINLIRKNKKENYPPMVIYNLPWPFVLEEEVIIQGRNSRKFVPYLISGAKILEKAGADFGILPCNTLHKHMEEIREAVKIPFLSIIDETALELESLGVNCVGILGTQVTAESKMYDDVLGQKKIDIAYPDINEQSILDKIIVDLVRGNLNEFHAQKIRKICDSLQKRGVNVILLACTDLQLAIADDGSAMPIIDTTKILINAAVREIIK